MSQTIALFGATGGSGRAFLPKALAAGHHVRALVRTPAKLTISHERLTVIQGDMLNPADVRRTVEGSDVVVSLIGQDKQSPKDLQTRGIQHVVDAVKAGQPRKIISLTGGAVPYAKDQPKLIDKIFRGVMGLFFKSVVEDATAHARVLERSGLPYVIVRGPRLTDGPEKGEYRVGYVGVDASASISRADLADFLLRQLDDDQYLGDMPFVSY